MTELLEIDPNECWELLGRCTVGRLAVNLDHRGPLVVPVNFVLVDGYVVFRSDPGTKLGLIEAGPVSFQVDSIDHGHHTGWSVLVRGVAHEADGWELPAVALEPWAGGEKAHWVRLLPTAITGRRVVAGELPYDDRGYR
jgi:nitroimidazol reductase NimA-like FMN-containing flavoprotein (pyridoxamine 5'-phosphate oxidase superfamily)